MPRHARRVAVLLFLFAVTAGLGADWRQFRGPGSEGISTEKGLPVHWSSKVNIAWQTKLPGPGASSPIVTGDRVFVTCYSGYGLGKKDAEKMEDLRQHVMCVDRIKGDIIWAKEFKPLLPEREYYKNEADYHGYAAGTPITDGKRLYVFFGKSGVYCLDLDGNEIWHELVGKRTHNWGSGASPMFYKDLLIVNASVEDGAVVALNKESGKPAWKAPKVNSAWNTPIVVPVPGKATELVISMQNWVVGLDPDRGKELWRCDGVHRYVVPSVVAHDGIVYVVGGGSTSLAVRAGGRGDVTKTHVLWRMDKASSNVSSPVYQDGRLYYAGDGGFVLCQNAADGKSIYRQRLDPPPPDGKVWASPVLADGKLYYVSKLGGTYVVAAGPKYDLVAHNVFADDKSRSSASIAVSDRHLFLRTDQYLYCIGMP
jgi:outer membrane protein assembly factor BamB